MNAKSRLVLTLAMTLGIAAAACGQNAGILGPVMGHVVDDATYRVQPMLGLPGAATIGNPIELGVELRQVTVSPEGGYALGVRTADGAVMMLPRTINREEL